MSARVAVCRASLCVVASLAACTDDAPTVAVDAAVDARDAAVDDRPPGLAHPSGFWAPGDLHVHASGASNDTRGMSRPADIAAVARARGLQWLVLTDHSNSTGSDPTTRDEDPALYNRGPEFPYADEAARLSEAGRFVMVDGNEVSPVWSLDADAGAPEPRGHVGCIPPGDLAGFRARADAVAFTDRPPGAVRGGDAVAAVHGLGAWAVVNHPYAFAAPHIAYDWTARDYDAMEVWNGSASFDAGDAASVRAWLCDLASGRAVTAVGGSDCHEAAVEYPGSATNPAIGAPTTSVWVTTLTWPAVFEGLRQGRAVVHDAESFVALWAAPTMADRAVMPGDALMVTTGTEAVFELEGTASATSTVTLYRTAAGSCRDTRAPRMSVTPEVTPAVAFRTDVPRGAFRVLARVRVEAGDAVMHAELHARGVSGFEDHVALTNALRVTGR